MLGSLIIIFLLSFYLTYLYKNWAIKLSILDIPNKRSSHITPTPRGGGIVLVISFFISLFYLYQTGQIEKDLLLSLLPGIVLASIGFVDDLKRISSVIRLTVQFICSGFALYFLGGFEGFFGDNLKWFWSLIALLGFVWFINLFNFLDGSDGYASMESISVVLVLWYFTGIDILLFLGFSIGGFLVWNWPKAKVFMGDAGSTTLGFFLVVFGVYLHNRSTLNLFFWLIITSLFWFDATITLIRRILNKEKLSLAHKNHIYQRAIQGGFSHLRTMLSGLGINVFLFLICVLINRDSLSMFGGFLSIFVVLLTSMFYVDRKYPFTVNP